MYGLKIRIFYVIFLYEISHTSSTVNNKQYLTSNNIEYWSNSATNFMASLLKCTIRFVGKQNHEYFDYFISNHSPIIIEDFYRVDKYVQRIMSNKHIVQWNENSFIGKKYTQCSATIFEWNDEHKVNALLNGIMFSGREVPDYFIITIAESEVTFQNSMSKLRSNLLRHLPIPSKYVILFKRNFTTVLSYLCLHCSKPENVLVSVSVHDLHVTGLKSFDRAWKAFHTNFMQAYIYTSQTNTDIAYYLKNTKFCNNYKDVITSRILIMAPLQPTTCILANLMDFHNCSFRSSAPGVLEDIEPNAIASSTDSLNFVRSGQIRYLSNAEFKPLHYKVTLAFNTKEFQLATMNALSHCMDSATWICTLITVIALWLMLVRFCVSSDSEYRKDSIRLLLSIYGTLVSNCRFKNLGHIQAKILLFIWLYVCIIISNGFSGILFSLMTKLVTPDLPKSYEEVMQRNYLMLSTNEYQGPNNPCGFKWLIGEVLERRLRGENDQDMYKKLGKSIQCVSDYELIKLLLNNDITLGRYFAVVDPEDTTKAISNLMEGFFDKVISPIGEMPSGFSILTGICVKQNFIPEIISSTISSFYESGISNLWKQREEIYSFFGMRQVMQVLQKYQTEPKSINKFIRRKISNRARIFDNDVLPLSMELVQPYLAGYCALLGICLLIFVAEFISI